MSMRVCVIAGAMVLGLASAPAEAALIVPIVSGDGETWIGGTPIGGGGGTTVVVDPHPAWQPPGAALWVSYADTGYAGGLLAPPSGTTSIFTLFESFQAGAGSILNMRIWADDTARVRINGVEIIAPNFSQDTCAGGSIGCQPNEYGSIVDHIFQTSGLQTISLEVFQVGTGQTTTANPFGVLYEGTLEIEEAPEPGGMMLFGFALLGLARQLRRVWQPSQD